VPSCLFFLAITYTAFLILNSLHHGKLLAYPIYDDISYFTQALSLLDAARAGPLSLLRDYTHSPPHSPIQIVMAAAAFAIFGVRNWAPYIPDALIVWGLLLATDAMLGSLRWFYRLPIWLFVLATPLTSYAVLEFRPDIACGLATACGAFLLCSPTSLDKIKSRSRLAGFLFGLALLLKPSVFPFTLFIAGSAMALNAIQTRKIKPLLQTVWPIALLALLYYPFGFLDIVEYIRNNAFGRDANLWQPARGLYNNLNYYLADPGGDVVLGAEFPFLLFVALLGLVLQPRGKWPLLLIILEAFLVPALNPVKNFFLAATFHCMLLLAALRGISVLLEVIPPRRPTWLHASALWIILASVAIAWGWRPESAGIAEIDQAHRDIQIVDGVFDSIRSNASPGARVFLTSSGTVNVDVLRYLSHREGVSFEFSELQRESDPAKYAPAFADADVVVASERINLAIFRYVPSAGVQEKCLQMLRADPHFQEIAHLQPGYILFIRLKNNPNHQTRLAAALGRRVPALPLNNFTAASALQPHAHAG